MVNLYIDPEFRDLIPPLTKEEYAGLEASILAEGCRETIINWRTTVVDGHNRHEICLRHNIPFRNAHMDFASREDVKMWIINNQLSRRNICEMVRGELVLKGKDIVAEIARAKRELGGVSPNSDEPPMRTDETLAKKAGIGKDTLRKVEKILKSPVQELSRMTRENRVSINAAAAVAKLPEVEQREVVEAGPQAVKDKAKLIRNATTDGKPKSKSISIGPATYKKLLGVIENIAAMCRKPSSQVSVLELRTKAEMLLETFSGLSGSTE